MTWFKVDDQFATHSKAVLAGNAACGLWVRAGSWSAAQLTDGHIPAAVVSLLGGRPADARKLAEVGLWHAVGHDCDACPQPTERGAHVFHRWPDFQPTKADVEKKRSEARERMARNRAGSREVRANSEGTSRSVPLTPSRPVPTRPEDASASSKRGGGGGLPGDIEVLRSKMSAITAFQHLIFDVDPDKLDRISRCIEQHGDQALVDLAVRLYRADDPPRYVTWFLANWEALGAPRAVVTAGPRCVTCNRTKTACERAARTVDPDDRHEFRSAS